MSYSQEIYDAARSRIGPCGAALAWRVMPNPEFTGLACGVRVQRSVRRLVVLHAL